MSDIQSGARAPAGTPGLVPTDPEYTDSGSGDSPASDKAKQVVGQSGQAATRAASDVKDTAAEQARRVAGETKTQVRNVAGDLRDRLDEQAHTQNDKLVGSIRQTADQLDEMRGDRQDSPAATVVSRVAEGGRQLADYLDRNGPDGVLREVQDFARRRPGAFLASALVAGFVIGRLGKGIAKADPTAGDDKPDTDTFVSGSMDAADGVGTHSRRYDTGSAATEYAATGTGTPRVVEEEYPLDGPVTRP